MKKESVIKVAILTNVLPVYREGFYQRLFSSIQLKVSIYCQDHIPGANFNTIHDKYPKQVSLVKFISIKGGQFIWQFIPWIKIMKSNDIIFIDGNPRIASQAIFATFLRLIGRKVVIWSMVHSHNNNAILEGIRLKWLKLFRYHFLYNDLDIDRLLARGFNKKIMVAMNNGLDQKKIDRIIREWSKEKLLAWQADKELIDKSCIVSCGRLIAKNKYDLIVRALKDLKTTFPNILWLCIGSGEERENLEQLSTKLGVENHVWFLGAIYEEEKLCPWFLSSDFFLHPAAIGLSIMHAYGYGLPLITHDMEELHGPEFVAFESETRGRVFKEGDAESLARTIGDLLLDQENLATMKLNVQDVVRTKYNVDIMSNRFTELVKTVYHD